MALTQKFNELAKGLTKHFHKKKQAEDDAYTQSREEAISANAANDLLSDFPPATNSSAPQGDAPKKKVKKSLGKAPKRIAFAIVLCAMMGAGGYMYMSDQTSSTSSQATNGLNSKSQSNSSPQVAEVNPALDPNANPFVEIKGDEASNYEGESITPREGAVALPPVPAIGGSSHHQSAGVSQPSASTSPAYIPRPYLPPVPAIPAPNAQAPTAVPKPTVPPPATQTAPAKTETPTVSGIITGEGGANAAIMSDGTVVSEGETYHDNRVAYIGGDGIKFADGSKMDLPKGQ